MTFSKWDELVKATNKAEIEAKTAADWARKKWAEYYRAKQIAEQAQQEAQVAAERMSIAQATLEAERTKLCE